MNVGDHLRATRGADLDALVLERYAMVREWGETDASLRNRAAVERARPSNPWIRRPAARFYWWARLWFWFIGGRPQTPEG